MSPFYVGMCLVSTRPPRAPAILNKNARALKHIQSFIEQNLYMAIVFLTDIVHWTHNPRVVSSSPTLCTTSNFLLFSFFINSDLLVIDLIICFRLKMSLTI